MSRCNLNFLTTMVILFNLTSFICSAISVRLGDVFLTRLENHGYLITFSENVLCHFASHGLLQNRVRSYTCACIVIDAKSIRTRKHFVLPTFVVTLGKVKQFSLSQNQPIIASLVQQQQRSICSYQQNTSLQIYRRMVKLNDTALTISYKKHVKHALLRSTHCSSDYALIAQNASHPVSSTIARHCTSSLLNGVNQWLIPTASSGAWTPSPTSCRAHTLPLRYQLPSKSVKFIG